VWNYVCLDDIAIGTVLLGLFDFFFLVEIGHDDDLGMVFLLAGVSADFAQHFQAVDTGNHDVEQYKVGLEFGGGSQGGVAVAGDLYRAAAVLQDRRIDVCDVSVVFNQ